MNKLKNYNGSESDEEQYQSNYNLHGCKLPKTISRNEVIGNNENDTRRTTQKL